MPHKLIIRRLPPTLPEETFWNAVRPWVNDTTCLWKRYVKGELSRAYVLLMDPETVVAFHKGFDGHIFKSKQGEYQAVVEFAPYQKTPYKAKVKVDARMGTIKDDPDFNSYITTGKRPEAVPQPVPTPTSTPLLDHLRATKKAKEKAKKEAPKDAAIASVHKAAAKRTPKDPQGKMTAGKGREVTVEGGKEQGKRKQRKKPKEGKEGESAVTAPQRVKKTKVDRGDKNTNATVTGILLKDKSSKPPSTPNARIDM